MKQKELIRYVKLTLGFAFIGSLIGGAIQLMSPEVAFAIGGVSGLVIGAIRAQFF